MFYPLVVVAVVALTLAAPCAAGTAPLGPAPPGPASLGPAPPDPAPDAPRSQALWRIVDGGCNHGAGAPAGLRCMPAAGYAVMKDRCGATHYLLIPLARRTGIESPELLRAGEPNYFQDAWDERGVVADAAAPGSAPSDDEIGLAINSNRSCGR